MTRLTRAAGREPEWNAEARIGGDFRLMRSESRATGRGAPDPLLPGYPARMRLFIAIPLSPDAAGALRAVRDRFASSAAGLRWSADDAWHVTLQFLGETTSEQAACITASLAGIHARQVPVRLTGLGFFDKAGVFHAGVDHTPELLALQQQVLAATRACGIIPEPRAYNAHITLARAKGHTGAKALAPLKEALRRSGVTLAAQFVADEFLLYESFPGPDGSRYEARARFPLAAPS